MEWTEIIGYAGSVLIAVSLTMKNFFMLRKINLIGALTFAAYGLLLPAYPVLVLNIFIIIVDVYYLAGMYMKKDAFNLMPVLDPGHPYLNKFLDFYRNDIKKFSPDFEWSKIEGANCYFILRNLVPVGIFIYKEESTNVADILLDYAIPDYRDLKNAEYLYFAQSKFLKEKGIKYLTTEGSIKKHRKYLQKVGFKQDSNKENIFKKTL
jgi:hypothetical protein